MRESLLIPALLVSAVALSSCGGSNCPLTCPDGVVLSVVDGEGEAVGRFDGEVSSDASAVEFGCNGTVPTTDSRRGYQCLDTGEVVLFAAGAVDELDITVMGSAGSWSQTVMPTYEPVNPNGPQCGVECQQAEVEATLE